jgi:hypothetical protein
MAERSLAMEENEEMTLEVAAEMLADACAYATLLMNTMRDGDNVDENQWDNARDASTAALNVYWALVGETTAD